jgi:hypothetical protein
MPIPTEPIGSIPRPPQLIEAMQAFAAGELSAQELERLGDEAVRDTISRFEATGSPVITDDEQTKPSFATYPIHGLDTLAPDGVTIPFADGHTRQLPRLTAGPFRYQVCRSYPSSSPWRPSPTSPGWRRSRPPAPVRVRSPCAITSFPPDPAAHRGADGQALTWTEPAACPEEFPPAPIDPAGGLLAGQCRVRRA